MKKWMVWCLIAALLLSLSGCGASTEPMEAAEMIQANTFFSGVYDSLEKGEMAAEAEVPAEENAGVQNQKLIRTMRLEVETEALDELLGQLTQKINGLQGYVENKTIRNGGSSASRRYRYANLVIRVPVDTMDEFIDHVSQASNVVSYTENADDITLTYVATQSRITALETEQTRLLELLAKAENMTDLLQIEARLTEVRTELEQVTSQLRLYDNQVDYGTIELSVTEVQEFTVVEEETVWQRIGSGLKENWQSLCRFAENLFVFLIVSLPYLIPIGIAAALIGLLVKRTGRKRPPKPRYPQQPPQPPKEG